MLYALGKVPTTVRCFLGRFPVPPTDALTTQLFFGERAWRLTDKSIVLATVLSILVYVAVEPSVAERG